MLIVEPLFLDDELAKASLVGPAVVGRDGRVAGTLFYSHIVQTLKYKLFEKEFKTLVSMLVSDMLSGDVCIRWCQAPSHEPEQLNSISSHFYQFFPSFLP